MKYRLFLSSFLLSLLLTSHIFAQADTTRRPIFIQKAILPSTLILSGSLINGHTIEKKLSHNFQFAKTFTIEDYIQFVPIGQLYLADILKIKSKNHWFDQSKYLAMSGLLDVGIVLSIKHLTQKTRPNGHPFSFPSGHTSFAFMGATVLYEEFVETRPILAYSGYGFAVATGALRIANQKHWLSDVLVGAGIGILSTRLIYHFEPLKKWNPFLKGKAYSVSPSFQNGFALRLKISLS